MRHFHCLGLTVRQIRIIISRKCDAGIFLKPIPNHLFGVFLALLDQGLHTRVGRPFSLNRASRSFQPHRRQPGSVLQSQPKNSVVFFSRAELELLLSFCPSSFRPCLCLVLFPISLFPSISFPTSLLLFLSLLSPPCQRVIGSISRWAPHGLITANHPQLQQPNKENTPISLRNCCLGSWLARKLATGKRLTADR